MRPHAGHNKERRPDCVGSAECRERLMGETIATTLECASLFERRHLTPELKAESWDLLRDTLKVTGQNDILAPAVVGIFYVDLSPQPSTMPRPAPLARHLPRCPRQYVCTRDFPKRNCACTCPPNAGVWYSPPWHRPCWGWFS